MPQDSIYDISEFDKGQALIQNLSDFLYLLQTVQFYILWWISVNKYNWHRNLLQKLVLISK